ncbi:YqzE family protein [Peribacillus deserti]|uniref:YqzE family protein n=1 Tax=Peribacillus deserti TaxID=673318 RepID=A0A2N5M487_9BACI|nr:YqzE family protein [Peribacillus deserti]PLT29177.1 YqzE family protein [Peribacillus deserti]
MSTNDLIKYVTQQLVLFYDQPKEQRKSKRLEKKQAKTSLSYNLFGFIPLSLSMLFKKN